MTPCRLKLLSGLLLAMSVCACSHQKTLSPEEIKIQIGTVRALAAATELLCVSLANGNTTLTFFKTQAALIADKAGSAASGLDGSGGAAEETRRRGQVIAAELQTLCRNLENDPGAVARSTGQARSLTNSASELEDTLEHARLP